MLDQIQNKTKFQKFIAMIKPKLPDTLKKIIQEHDHATYSSARAWGGWIFLILGVCNLILAGSISWGIHRIIITTPIDNAALLSLVMSIKNLAWLYLVLAATALALYGINVWKYIAQIRNGIYNKVTSNTTINDDDPDTFKPQNQNQNSASDVNTGK